MDSSIVAHLHPEFEPVALVWSDRIPEGAVEFKAGRFGCILNLFAEASRKGRVAGGSRDTIVCPGRRAALGFGVDLIEPEERLDHFSAFFSKGLSAARDKDIYRTKMESAKESSRPRLEFGERDHCSFDMARKWITDYLPRYDISSRYVLFKPLRAVDPEDEIRSVIFPVSPVELAGLVTLLGSVVDGPGCVTVPKGADCLRLGCSAYDLHDADPPRAVLGMLAVDGRTVMRERFREDTLTLTIPKPLFLRMEEEAADSVLTIPGWTALRGSGECEDLQ